MSIESIFSFLQRASAHGSRSTVLGPLNWLIGIIVAAILGCLRYNAPVALLLFFAVIIGFGVLLYLVAYAYCLKKDPELLRSEKYSIQKLAIQKAYVGDSSVGLIDENEIRPALVRAAREESQP